MLGLIALTFPSVLAQMCSPGSCGTIVPDLSDSCFTDVAYCMKPWGTCMWFVVRNKSNGSPSCASRPFPTVPTPCTAGQSGLYICPILNVPLFKEPPPTPMGQAPPLINSAAEPATIPALVATRRIQPAYFGRYNLPADFSMTFTLTLTGRVSHWSNILHFSKDDNDHTRAPAVFVFPGSTRLHIRFTTTTEWNDGFDPAPMLALGRPYKINIQALGRRIVIKYDDRVVGDKTLSGSRITADRLHFWYSYARQRAAYGRIGGFKVTRITRIN